MKLGVHAIFGGSFNPPHFGHLDTISAAAREFGLSKVNLLLAPQPPHKEIKYASLEQRMEMLALACGDYPLCNPDFTETHLPSPCYTVNTLRYLRSIHTNKSLVFFLGSDSLINIHTWYDWQQLLNYAHLVVLPRPQHNGPLLPKTADWIKTVEQTDKNMLKQYKNGCLFFAETPLWDVSSTQIRLRLNENVQMDNKQQHNEQQLLPQKVADYIKQHHLYDSTANSL